jgi:S-(hydroxymethyl)glutathione dehydrogenase/alcohol dehydrogenase
VEWKASGLCHSDEHFRSGDRVSPEAIPALFPFLGGHEGAGVVAAVGPGVTAFAEGDHVIASFSPTCGVCRYCREHRGHLCNENKDFGRKGQIADGTTRHTLDGEALYLMAKLGTFAERTVVSERSLVPVADDISLEVAALVACGVATGWGSAVRRAGTRIGDVVVVVGLGGLGISAVQGARTAGAAHVIGVDPLGPRRDVAQKLGATRTLATLDEVADAIAPLTNGQGADRVILTPGLVTGAIVEQGLAVTSKGGVCVVTGMGPIGTSPIALDIGAFALFSKDLRGCLFGDFDPREAAPFLLDLYRAGALDIDSMITTYPLADINLALAEGREGRNVRAVLTNP